MKTLIFWIVMGVTGVLISCKDPVAPLTIYPAVKLSKADSTRAARLNYNGDRPIWDDGEALPVYDNAIVDAPNDTIYFNKSRWNHWPVVKREKFIAPDNQSLAVSFIAGMGLSVEDIYEKVAITIKPRLGLHQGTSILSSRFVIFHVDAFLSIYELDPKQDNWVNVTGFDVKKGTASGSFSLHYLVQDKKPTVIDRVYPNTVHMHGSFR